MKTFTRFFIVILLVLLMPIAVLVTYISKMKVQEISAQQKRAYQQLIGHSAVQFTNAVAELITSFSLFSNSMSPVTAVEERSIATVQTDFDALDYRRKGMVGIFLRDMQGHTIGTTRDFPIRKNTLAINPMDTPYATIDFDHQDIVLHEQVMNDDGKIIGYISAVIDTQHLPISSMSLIIDRPRSINGVERAGRCVPQTIRYYHNAYPVQWCGDYSAFVNSPTQQQNNTGRLVVFIFSISLGTAILLAWIGARTLQKPISQLAELVRHHDSSAAKSYPHVLGALQLRRDEFGQLAQLIDQSQNTIKQLETEKSQLAVQAAIGKIAAQVSHDIRSPLTALRVLVGHLAGVPEEHRVMIRNAVQRIEDIANDLRAKQEQGTGEAANGATTRTDDRSVQLLSSLIEPLISEKRTQHRAKLGVEIHAALDAESYGLFAAVQPTELKRVISNLINNAVEAMARGLVTVAVRQDAEQVVITVTDTGKGIPPELLPQLMQQGATFGKADGSGLGLYHARITMESWGGTVTLTSRVGVGTTATVTVPRAEAPAWFVPELVLTPGSTIVIVDDDVSIHQIWQERLEALDLPAHEITLQHFSSGTDVVAWYQGQRDALFLCDYEFLGQPNNGLELIEQLGIHGRSILVTSHFDEAPIQQRCAALGVRLIPKGLAGFVPIRMMDGHRAEHAEEASQREESPHDSSATPQHNTAAKPTALVLDDDDGIRCVWPMEGRRLGLGSVTTFASMEACEAAAPDYAQFDFAFVDKNIPESTWRLDQVIAHLKACGVKKVLVASGESARALASDPLCAHADGVIPMKIPQKLPT